MPILDAILGLAQLLAVGLVLAIVGVTWLTVRKLRHPPRRTYAWAAARSRPGTPGELEPPRAYDERTFDTPAGPIYAWSIPGDDPSGVIVVACPGWGDSCIGMLARLGAFVGRARAVVVFDPPGHGETPESAGRTTLGIREPAIIRSIVDTLRDEHPGARFVLAGWSLGAGASIAAATKMDPSLIAGIVAEAPYDLAPTPARNVVRLSGLPWRINIPIAYFVLSRRLGEGLLARNFSRASYAARLPASIPLLVLHGSQDAISPPEDGERIAHAAPSATLTMIEGGGHNNLWTDDRFREATNRAVEHFLSGLDVADA